MRTGFLLLLCALSVAACGILNLGGVNADGSPKTPLQATELIRTIGDAGLRTWGTEALKRNAPSVLAAFDTNHNGELTLAEVEGNIDLTNAESTTALLVLAIELYRARP